MANNFRDRLRSRKEDINSGIKEDKDCCDNPCIECRDGNVVCLNCGMIFQKEFIDNERRAYTPEEVNRRKRTEPRWRDFGPRTMLPNSKIDSKGHIINANGKTLFSRLSKIQNSLISSIERNFWEAKPKLKMLTSKMNIPEYIKDTAWKIYCVVAKKKLTMGRSIDGFIAASMYAAIRVHEFPRLLEDVCDASMTDRHTVIRSLGIITKDVLPELSLSYKPITAEQLVFKFGNDLHLPMEVQKTALNILAKAKQKGLSCVGKDPKGLAASLIYMAAKKTANRKTQAEISEIAKITEVTLRNRVKEISTKL